MRRIALVGGIAAVLFAVTSAVAAAHMVASGPTKQAIVRSLPLKSVTGHCKAVRCWRVWTSSGWATSFDIGPGNGGAGEWMYISHRVKGPWRYIGGEGEGILFNCKAHRLRSATARDLKITCQ